MSTIDEINRDKILSDKIKLEEIYEPAEDTCLLLKAAMKEVQPQDSVLEIGCGKCVISSEVASRVKSLISTDINPHAVGLAKTMGLNTIRSDLFKGIKARFDLIIFNPPYLPTSAEERIPGWLNRAFDGGESGREVINRFLEDLEKHLTPGGKALLLVSSLTGLEDVKSKARSKELDVQVIAQERYFFECLYVLRIDVANIQQR